MYISYDESMDEEIPVTEARAQFSELINRVGFGKERIVLTRHGKPLVALVPAETLLRPGDDDEHEPTVLDLSSRTDNYRSSPLTIAAWDPTTPKA